MGVMGGTAQQFGHYLSREKTIQKILSAEGAECPELEDYNHPSYRRVSALADMSDHELYKSAQAACVDSWNKAKVK